MLQEILRRSDMAAVVGRYVRLRRQGRRLVGLCPFHSEKTPSFSIDPERGLFHCYGCHEGGTLFQFLARMEGISFPEAVQRLAREVGVQVELSGEASRQDSERERGLGLLEWVAGYYHEMLLDSPLGRAGLEYLQGRGISRAMVERFRLGWAPEGGQALVRQLASAGYSAAEGIRCGVLKDQGGRPVDLLRGRLVFPISDVQGRVLAFGGRTLAAGVQPKYLNTPETPWYAKRQHLYGLNLARGPVSRAQEAVLVEGYLDVVSLHQAGIDRAVASLGTALTPEQASLLRRYASAVVLAYDSDRAGQMATVKGIEIVEAADLAARVAVLPAGEDPDSLVRRAGGPALEEVLEQARDVVTYYMERVGQRLELSSAKGKEQFKREVLPAVQRVRDPARRSAYAVRLARMVGASERVIEELVSPRGTPVAAAPRARPRSSLDMEERLFRLLATRPEWIGVVREVLVPEAISRDELRPLLSALLRMEGRQAPIGVEDLLPYIQDQGMIKRVSEVLVTEAPEATEQDVRKLAQDLHRRWLFRRYEELKREVVPAVEAGTMSPDDELYQEYRRLQRHLKGAR